MEKELRPFVVNKRKLKIVDFKNGKLRAIQGNQFKTNQVLN